LPGHSIKKEVKKMEALKNESVYIEYAKEKKSIFLRDLLDQNNEPAAYNKSKRGLEKAWIAVKSSFTDETKFFDIIQTLENHKIRTHYWCMVD
jgi:hypothetical protein